jgi:hypothetical protein
MYEDVISAPIPVFISDEKVMLEVCGWSVPAGFASPAADHTRKRIDLNKHLIYNGDGGQAAVIDVTNLASASKEKRVGLRDEGQLTLTMHYNPDDTIHQGLRSDRANRVRRQFKLTFTDTVPAIWTFYGYVTTFSVQGGVDAVVQASVTIEIDGEITEA